MASHTKDNFFGTKGKSKWYQNRVLWYQLYFGTNFQFDIPRLHIGTIILFWYHFDIILVPIFFSFCMKCHFGISHASSWLMVCRSKNSSQPTKLVIIGASS